MDTADGSGTPVPGALSRLPGPARWALAVLLAAVCAGALVAMYAVVLLDLRWLPLLGVAPFLAAPLESLLLTPLYALTGRFRYYSPMLLATRGRGGGYDLHVGTLWDYAVRLHWADRGPRAARIVTADLLRGLLALADEVERGVLPPDAPLTGTSYFFSDRTAERLGFELREPARAVRLNLLTAGVSIALRLSFTRGRPTFPDLRRVRQIATTGERLARHRGEIQRMLRRLARPA